MLDTAVSVLATLPKKLDVLSQDGGAVSLEILGHDADTIQALAPVHRVRVGLRLRMRQRDEHGGGHDIDLRVSEIFYESDRAATLQLTVERLRRRSGCEVIEVAGSERARLAVLATMAQSSDSASERLARSA
jgi:hypothetical protein